MYNDAEIAEIYSNDFYSHSFVSIYPHFCSRTHTHFSHKLLPNKAKAKKKIRMAAINCSDCQFDVVGTLRDVRCSKGRTKKKLPIQ